MVMATASVRAGVLLNPRFEGGSTNQGTSHALDLCADTVPNNWIRIETFTGSIGGVPIAENACISVPNDNGPSAPGQSCLQCNRTENQPTSSGDWTAVQQTNLGLDVQSCVKLDLSIDTKVFGHNLEAGGFVPVAFEWPVCLEINYTTTGGASQIWRYGWYLENPGDSVQGPVNDPGQGLIPIYNDQQVPQGQWVTTQFDLLKELPQAKTIDRIRIGGSGWDYEGRADNLLLECDTIIPEPAAAVWLLVGVGTWLRRRSRSPRL
jgi:hypothetical protein